MHTALAQKTPPNPPAAAAGTASQPTSQPASGPARTPEEEAELAIRLADEGRAKDAMTMASSAYQRNPRAEITLLAMGVAMDANQKGYEAITYFKRYLDTPTGRSRDWRGHARLADIYLRAKKFTLAAQELEAAEKTSLFPGRTDPAVLAGLLADKVQAYLNSETDRKEEALAAAGQMATLVRGNETVRSQPQLVLECAKAGLALGQLWAGSADEPYEWVTQVAIPAARKRAEAAPLEEQRPWLVMYRCMQLAQQIRGYELDTLSKSEPFDAAPAQPPASPPKVSDDQEKGRLHRMERRILMWRDLAGLEMPMAEIGLRLKRLESLRSAKKAVAAFPDNKDFKYSLADIQLELNDTAGAAETYRAILKLVPSDRKALDALARIAASQPVSAPAAAQMITPPGR